MTTTEVLAGPVGAGGRNDGKDAKLVRRLLDDWRAREAGEPGDRPLPDGPMEPDTLAAIRAFRAWSGLDPDGLPLGGRPLGADSPGRPGLRPAPATGRPVVFRGRLARGVRRVSDVSSRAAMKAWPAAIAALIFLLPVALPAQHRRMEGIGFPDFWAKFERALSANDKAQIAAMTKFPFPYHVYGGNDLSKIEFVRRYDEIFDPVTRRCFAGTKARPTESARPGFVGYEVYCNSSIFTFEKLEGTYKFSEKYPDD